MGCVWRLETKLVEGQGVLNGQRVGNFSVQRFHLLVKVNIKPDEMNYSKMLKN